MQLPLAHPRGGTCSVDAFTPYLAGPSEPWRNTSGSAMPWLEFGTQPGVATRRLRDEIAAGRFRRHPPPVPPRWNRPMPAGTICPPRGPASSGESARSWRSRGRSP